MFKARDSNQLELKVFHDFVDRYVVRRIRKPDISIPSNIVDENMQEAFQTPF